MVFFLQGKGDGPMGAHAASPTVTPMKTPIILTKPSADRVRVKNFTLLYYIVIIVCYLIAL